MRTTDQDPNERIHRLSKAALRAMPEATPQERVRAAVNIIMAHCEAAGRPELCVEIGHGLIDHGRRMERIRS